jgi:Spy/CpxP family protein refolding chaperone
MNRSLASLLRILSCAALLLGSRVLLASQSESPASLAVLLGLPGVRQELAITPVQAGLLDAIQASYKARAKQITAIGMAEEDAAMRANWDLKSLRKQCNARAMDLLTPSQQDRLLQIQRQMLGGSLLSSPSEQKILGLSDAQRRTLATLAAAQQSEVNAVNAKSQTGLFAGYDKASELRRIQSETSKSMMAVLTPEQKKEWKILSGKKSGFPEVHNPNASAASLFEGY